MSFSTSYTETQTFSITHARHMASKVATDLKRMQRFYGEPSDQKINDYEAEITAFLKNGYLGTVWFGYKRSGNWIEPTLKYTSNDLAGSSVNDDDPGRIRPNKDITGASFYSYLTYNLAWHSLSEQEQRKFEESLPFQRGTADEPNVSGYIENDKSYSAGGKALNRGSVRSYS